MARSPAATLSISARRLRCGEGSRVIAKRHEDSMNSRRRRLTVRAALPLCLLVLTAGAGPLTTPGARDGGPRIPEPQGRFDATYVGPVEPLGRLGGGPVKTATPAQPDLVIRGLGFTSDG